MHIKANGSYDLPGFIGNELIGSMGEFVYLFMMISGFSMCCGYYNRIISNEIAVGEFYGKRYRKIWPYFAALCLLDFAISPSLESLYETFADLTLCFGLLPNANISVIGVGWFIGVVFKSISIRDSACREQLSAIVGKPVTTVVDPVLLIGQEGFDAN